MRKGTVTFVRKQFSNRKNLFLKDPNSDFFVILNQKIYPLHKAFINGIGYFEKIDFGSEKVHMIDSNLDVAHFIFSKLGSNQ